MCNGLEQVASLPDPIGTISNLMEQPSGIKVGNMNVPIGVILMIYESRPNVTVDAAPNSKNWKCHYFKRWLRIYKQ